MGFNKSCERWILGRVGIVMLAVFLFRALPAEGQTFTLTALSPSSAVAGSAGFTLIVNGTNFANDSVVRWNGSNRPTNVVNSSQLTAPILPSDVDASGTSMVTVINSSGAISANGLPFTINAPVPTTIGLVPNILPANSPSFTLTVSGTNFIKNSVVRWNGSDRPSTFFSSITMEAAIPASDLATPGIAEITVFNPSPGGGSSNVLLFRISATSPPPTITGISPVSAVAGGSGFTLTVTGTDFTAASVVQWNGSSRVTAFVNSTTLTAEIAATDIAAPGTGSITIRDTSPGGGVSNALTFDIEAFLTEYFSQVAVGGAFSTEISLYNMNGSAVTGNLFLTDQTGNPLVAYLDPGTTPGVGSPDGQVAAAGASLAVAIPARGMKVVTATSLSPADSTQTGWARFESTQGAVSGVATFLMRERGALKSIAGVMESPPLEFATIQVDNDDGRSRFTGFAVANPNREEINIKLVTLSESGAVVDVISPRQLNPLRPHGQVARFLHEYLPHRLKFKGSMVLMVQGGKKIIVTALVSNEGLFTAIPVIRGKASGIPE